MEAEIAIIIGGMGAATTAFTPLISHGKKRRGWKKGSIAVFEYQLGRDVMMNYRNYHPSNRRSESSELRLGAC